MQIKTVLLTLTLTLTMAGSFAGARDDFDAGASDDVSFASDASDADTDHLERREVYAYHAAPEFHYMIRRGPGGMARACADCGGSGASGDAFLRRRGLAAPCSSCGGSGGSKGGSERGGAGYGRSKGHGNGYMYRRGLGGSGGLGGMFGGVGGGLGGMGGAMGGLGGFGSLPSIFASDSKTEAHLLNKQALKFKDLKNKDLDAKQKLAVQA
ncbi:hypothetical protein IWQ60_009414 [Tieghemiomyces parasiticus]|uniref:Uncharacterized protein n=1 Tax=Tieghemiomyces parasiticus TaxID=78921 RepID=A0A9W8DL62_9FUNG|nr:hypothetical protein IWQ60_009414 [Tieghemiomyces parasiticus]